MFSLFQRAPKRRCLSQSGLGSRVSALEARALLSGSSLATEVGVAHASPHKASPGNFDGTWKINTITTFNLVVNQTGAKVTGTFVGSLGASQFNYTVHGHVHGDELKVKGKGLTNGQSSKVTMDVTLQTPIFFQGSTSTNTHGVKSGRQQVIGDHL